ncbi:hypothetical protein C8J57DRAFT_1290936 [Mycena rebaudengoi]|nr:hypothetical protein C8J57DRAFT_1290936 [Mycena rebaudengoi]
MCVVLFLISTWALSDQILLTSTRIREGMLSTAGSDSSFLVFLSSPTASRPRKNKPSFRCKFEACAATFTENHNLNTVKPRHYRSCKGKRSESSSPS